MHVGRAGANSFAMDTRSKRRWESPPISIENAAKFKQACKDYGFGPQHILPHGSYLINLASADPALLAKSYDAFVDELKRCEAMGIMWELLLPRKPLHDYTPHSSCYIPVYYKQV